MDVLQLGHLDSLRELARLCEGATRPVLVADGKDELLVVLTPRILEQLLLACPSP